MRRAPPASAAALLDLLWNGFQAIGRQGESVDYREGE
jgi:hypothetical protein